MQQNENESNLRALAERLQFTVEKVGDRFTLTRTADVAQPVCEEGLTLTQAEELLEDFAVVELSIRRRIAANSSGIGSVTVSANHDCTAGVSASMTTCRP